jgi:hypothetical protein
MAGMGEREMVKTQLRSLRRGRLFWLNGERHKLLYCTPCRAHVQLPKVKVVVNGKVFYRIPTSDWAPTTVVDVTGRAA